MIPVRDYQLHCPVCGYPVRQNHTCHATSLADPPLEGAEAVEAARRVKAALQAVKHGGVPTEPQQPHMDFGSEGL